MESTLGVELPYSYIGLLPDAILVEALQGVVDGGAPGDEVLLGGASHEFGKVISELNNAALPPRAEWGILFSSKPNE